MSRSSLPVCSRVRRVSPNNSPFAALQLNRQEDFDRQIPASEIKVNDVFQTLPRLPLCRSPYVGAFAFGLFAFPCLATSPIWAQTPGDISSPPVVDRQAQIDATQFSSGIYGDPSPNAPSPFVEAPTSTPLPPFFSGDAADAVPGAARNQLEALAWAVGCWELESAGFVFQTKIDWAPGGSYLLCRDFVRPVVAPTSASALAAPASQNGASSSAATSASTPKFAALRVVGWNPVAGLFQSTIFCRDGSYGTGLWQREGESWRVATRILLVDGRAATSVEYFSPRAGGGIFLTRRSLRRERAKSIMKAKAWRMRCTRK